MSSIILVLILLVVPLLIVAGLLWMRKFQYDSIELNLRELNTHIKGAVSRANVFQRPYFRGELDGKEVSVGITSERHQGKREIYIYYTIACQSSKQLSILSKEWLFHREGKEGHSGTPIAGGKFMLQTSQIISSGLQKEIEKIILKFSDFAYILVADTGIILEQISTDLIEDTRVESVLQVFSGLDELSKLMVK